MKTCRMLAIDLGASGGKCFAAELSGENFALQEVHRFAHEGVPFYIADRQGALTERMYWDDVLLYANIVEGLRQYRRAAGPQLDAIGIDTWGADGQFVTADGEMLGKIHCYRDHRLDGMIEEVKRLMDPGRIYAITGIHFQPFNVSNQLRWFVTRRRELLRPGVFYLPIPSVFYYYLGGARQVDSSWASVTQLMDAQRRVWSREILDALEIPADVLPPIVAPGTDIGQLHAPLAEAAGVTRARLIAVAAHDTACAFAAAPLDNPAQSLIVSSGTWSLIGKLRPEPVTTPEAMACNISNEGGVGNVRVLKNCMGTWIVQELRRIWRLADGREMDWNEIVALADAAPAFGAFIDPDDPGFFNPANMETAIADFCRRTGQTPPASRGACLRAVYESLALKYRTVNERICAVTGTTTRSVHIVGGGSKNERLNQFVADALDLPVLAGPEEATAIGNGMIQALGLGAFPSLADALPIVRRSFPIRRYTPREPDAWRKAYQRFRRVTAPA